MLFCVSIFALMSLCKAEEQIGEDEALVNSFDDYAANYKNCDQEHKNVLLKIILKNKGINYDNLLIVGAGPNPNTLDLKDIFNNIYLLDPNPNFYKTWQTYDWFNNKNIIAINDYFLNMNVSNNIKFDFISHSQVFYYLKRDDIIKHINLMNDLLSDSGKFVINLAKDDCCQFANFAKFIQNEYNLSTYIKNILIDNDFSFEEDVTLEDGFWNADNEIKHRKTIMLMHLNDFIVNNTDYNNVISYDNAKLIELIDIWVENNMRSNFDPQKPYYYRFCNVNFIVNKKKT